MESFVEENLCSVLESFPAREFQRERSFLHHRTSNLSAGCGFKSNSIFVSHFAERSEFALSRWSECFQAFCVHRREEFRCNREEVYWKERTFVDEAAKKVSCASKIHTFSTSKLHRVSRFDKLRKSMAMIRLNFTKSSFFIVETYVQWARPHVNLSCIWDYSIAVINIALKDSRQLLREKEWKPWEGKKENSSLNRIKFPRENKF